MPTFDHHRGQHVDVAGARIYAEHLGAAESRIVVLLHGGFGNMEDFNAILSSLEGFRVIGIDSRGHGKSTLGNERWTYQRVQEDVEEVLRELGVRRCAVLGFSDGGTVALRLAAAGKVQIERLVVVGCSWHSKNLSATRELLQSVTGESWRKKFPATYEAYQRLNPEPDFGRLAKAVVPGWLDEGPSGHPDETVSRIQMPALIARGDDDHLTSLLDAVELRGRLAHGHFLNVPFAGHVAYADGAEVFVPALRRFLQQDAP